MTSSSNARYRFILAALGALWLVACASVPPRAPYPHEYLLTIVAEFKLAWRLDPLSQKPGEDLDGQNIYRVTLDRLDSVEDLTAAEYDDILAFTRGQCLERLGRWDEAAAAFNTAAALQTSLAPDAEARAAAATAMHTLTGRAGLNHGTLGSYLNDLEVMDRRLMEWEAAAHPWPYAQYARLEAERCRRERIRLLFDNRRLLEDGAARALKLAEALTADFTASWQHNEDWLLTGTLYETLARDWAEQNPPTGLDFDVEGPWSQWAGQARAAYRHAAQADGDLAKPEGQARLRALDAYILRVRNLAR